MNPVFLHIGMPKTGTTSIQHFLNQNRRALCARGFVVPRTPGRTNHKNLALYALPDHGRQKMRRANGLDTPGEIMRFRELFLTRFAEEAASWSNDQTVVLSSEHMSLLRKPDDFQRLKRLLAVMGDRPIRIVIYLRRQDLFYLSGYSQRIKSGASLHWSDLGEKFDPSAFDYQPI